MKLNVNFNIPTLTLISMLSLKLDAWQFLIPCDTLAQPTGQVRKLFQHSDDEKELYYNLISLFHFPLQFRRYSVNLACCSHLRKIQLQSRKKKKKNPVMLGSFAML